MQIFSRTLGPVVISLVLFGGVAYARDILTVEVTPSIVEQGGVCLIMASGSKPLKTVHGEFDGAEFPLPLVARDGTFQGLLGIDMNKNPGPHDLRVIGKTTDGELLIQVHRLRVERVAFSTQRLTLPQSMVDLDPETLERVNKESKRMRTLFKGYREERLWRGGFVRPVEGEVTTPFGVRRILNDQPRNPHTGVDLRAMEGTPIRACNDGVVVLVDELFFNGKSVVLDHGFGMYSMYFHLSEARVQEEETVAKGNVIGLAGSTGRASGPHLHWGIRLNGARVDPLSMMELNDYLQE